MFNIFNKQPKPVAEIPPIVNTTEVKEENINEKALALVKPAREVLDLVLKDPKQANFHSKISGSQWNIDYLREVEAKLEELYKTNNFKEIKEDIPKEVFYFQNDFNKFRYSTH